MACSRNILSSKSKRKSSSKVEELVDMDTDIPSEHLVMTLLKLRRRKKSQLKEHQKARVRGNKLLESLLKGKSVDNVSKRSKRLAKECPVSATIVVKYIRPTLVRMKQRT